MELNRPTHASTQQKWQRVTIGAAISAVLVFLAWTHHRNVYAADTLVVYIFSDTEQQYTNNLNYFIAEAVRADDGADYYIILQGGTQDTIARLPSLPKNAHYVLHENQCFDLGSFGWLVNDSGLVDMRRYRFVIWLNSSARGPFLPEYVQGRLTWHQIFTQHLDSQVKLVGATLNCERPGDLQSGSLHTPHIQTYVGAVDRQGLQLLQDASALACHSTYTAAIHNGEIATSRAMLEAGFNIFSMMARYRGVDWRNRSNWDCNAGRSPIHGLSVYDGVDVHPYEVLFVKVKQHMMNSEWPSVKYALKYQEWAAQPGPRRNVSTNEKITKHLELANTYGMLCFDAPYYRKAHGDLAHLSDSALLEHFVLRGAKEDRKNRFKCGHKHSKED